MDGGIVRLSDRQKEDCRKFAESFLSLAEEGQKLSQLDILDTTSEHESFLERIQEVDDMFVKTIFNFYFEAIGYYRCEYEAFWEMILLEKLKDYELFKRLVALACAGYCFTSFNNFSREDIFELIETGRNEYIENRLEKMDFGLADKVKCTKADKNEILQTLIQFLDINLNALIHKLFTNDDKPMICTLYNEETENDSLTVPRHVFLEKYKETLNESNDPIYVCYEMIYYLTAYDCVGRDLLLKLILLDHFYLFRHSQLSVKGKVPRTYFSRDYTFVPYLESHICTDDNREWLYITKMKHLYFYLGEEFCNNHSITSSYDYSKVLMKNFDAIMTWHMQEHVIFGRMAKYDFFPAINKLTVSEKKVSQGFEDIVEAYLREIFCRMSEKSFKAIVSRLQNDNIFIALLFSSDKVVVKAVDVLREHSESLAAEFVGRLLYLWQKQWETRRISDKEAIKAKKDIVRQYEKKEEYF